MKIFTDQIFQENETLMFWGDGENPLSVDDVIYLWQDRKRDGLGEEIIYGSAVVTKVLGTNFYEARRT